MFSQRAGQALFIITALPFHFIATPFLIILDLVRFIVPNKSDDTPFLYTNFLWYSFLSEDVSPPPYFSPLYLLTTFLGLALPILIFVYNPITLGIIASAILAISALNKLGLHLMSKDQEETDMINISTYFAPNPTEKDTQQLTPAPLNIPAFLLELRDNLEPEYVFFHKIGDSKGFKGHQ